MENGKWFTEKVIMILFHIVARWRREIHLGAAVLWMPR
jgi:hypothetical protein